MAAPRIERIEQTVRNERLSALIQEKIGGLIVLGKIKDPRVDSFLSVTRVDAASDLSCADVFVSSWKTEKGLQTGVAGLQNAASFIQRELAKTLKTRQTPKLRFHADTGVKAGFEMVKKIEDLAKEHLSTNAQ
ncbi:MAG: 30S ribosome-binding factor RbfA [Spirochaetaceae bacterium]|jgi:ribosome-binding factor A|nr:30S ribosome-binding factor RbfA [Spirochaetaceae bacterium]